MIKKKKIKFDIENIRFMGRNKGFSNDYYRMVSWPKLLGIHVKELEELNKLYDWFGKRTKIKSFNKIYKKKKKKLKKLLNLKYFFV